MLDNPHEWEASSGITSGFLEEKDGRKPPPAITSTCELTGNMALGNEEQGPGDGLVARAGLRGREHTLLDKDSTCITDAPASTSRNSGSVTTFIVLGPKSAPPNWRRWGFSQPPILWTNPHELPVQGVESDSEKKPFFPHFFKIFEPLLVAPDHFRHTCPGLQVPLGFCLLLPPRAKHFSGTHAELLLACSWSLWTQCLSFASGTSQSKTRELGPGHLPQHCPPSPTEFQRESKTWSQILMFQSCAW